LSFIVMADSILERLLIASALTAAMSDVAASAGSAYSFPLPLFALLCLWSANPRGLLLYGGLNVISIIFDVAYLGAQGSGAYAGGRPSAAVGASFLLRRPRRVGPRALARRAGPPSRTPLPLSLLSQPSS
jgi:hypothetical protein